MTLHIDFETRSTVDIKKTGAYVYAEHPTTDLWCACYAFDDGPVETWQPGAPCPDAIFDHVIDGGLVYAHNAAFERVIWHHVLAKRYGWPEPSVTQWCCTMVMAYAMALPGALEDAAPAAGIGLRKDAAGHRLMLQMARPRKVAPDGIIWWDDPAKLERLIAYCRTDVEVERELAKRLRPLKQSELDLWHLDQVINDRGVFVDVPLCNAAKAVVATTADRLDDAMRAVTEGAVGACSNVGQLIAWARTFGVETESIAKDVLEELLATDLPAPVRAALELRREAAKASVAKIDALLRGMGANGRAKGLLQFHAAGTGRWAGRRFQPQNLKRPQIDDTDTAIGILMSGDADLVEALYGEPLSVVGDCIRGMVAAPPGRKIIAADYANIEGRVLAWLAGEEWKLDAFRAYDAGTGPDLYKVAYGRAFGIAPKDVSKPQRQIGKVMELALGYQGGVGAFQTMAVNYGVRLPDEEVETLRDGWRSAHPAIKSFWWDLERAAIDAVENPGKTTAVRDIRFKVAGSFLFMRLPSGRFLAYAYPEIQPKVMPWKDDRGNEVVKDSLSYMGVNSYTRKWERCFAYGGLLAENCLAGQTPVLTRRGWVNLAEIRGEDELWDGCAWVRHEGVIAKGVSETEDFGGILITTEHKVLTSGGWRAAGDCRYDQAASQSAELDGAGFWLSDGRATVRKPERKDFLDGSLRVRQQEGSPSVGVDPKAGRQSALLRVHDEAVAVARPDYARQDAHRDVLHLAGDDRPLPAPEPRGVPQLRRPRHWSLRAVAEVRELLRRYARGVREGADTRPPRQRGGLFSRQLPLGRSENAGQQQEGQRLDPHAAWPDDSVASGGNLRNRGDDHPVPDLCRLAGTPVADRPRLHQPGGRVAVYDIVNAGPRHRFTVRGADGRMVIVSNCTQAVARDILADAMPRLEGAGYPIILTIHDEIVCEVEADFGSVDEMVSIMTTLPPWAAGCPITAEGWQGERYRK